MVHGQGQQLSVLFHGPIVVHGTKKAWFAGNWERYSEVPCGVLARNAHVDGTAAAQKDFWARIPHQGRFKNGQVSGERD